MENNSVSGQVVEHNNGFDNCTIINLFAHFTHIDSIGMLFSIDLNRTKHTLIQTTAKENLKETIHDDY